MRSSARSGMGDSRRSARWVVRALAGIGALAILWLVYVIAAPEVEDVDLRVLAPPADEARYDPIAAVALPIGAPILDGNRVEPLHDGEEFFPAMLTSIRAARSSIELVTFLWSEGAIAARFAQELAAAAGRGVEVRVLLDAYGAAGIDERELERMREAGCRVAWFHPIGWSTLRRVNNRSHRRALVVDGEVAYTGGAGIGEEWMVWRDDQFRVRGPAVAYLRGAFAENWRQATGEALALPPRPPSAGGARLVPIAGEPGPRSAIPLAYWIAIESARQRIDLATPYFVPESDLLEALVRAAQRGVRVRVLVPGDHNDSRLARWASRTTYRGLLGAGVELWEYRPAMYHVKAMTIDGRWSLVGSANFDNRSFERNYEVMLYVEDAALADALSASFARDLSRARRITRDEIEAWSPLARARDRLASLLKEQL